jgi:hypothetical protein
MDTLPLQQRIVFALKRLIALVTGRARRFAGGMLGVVLKDEIGDLSRQTQRLGSASVESVTYVGSELRGVDERLARIEAELAALRAMLEAREGAAATAEVASPPQSR